MSHDPNLVSTHRRIRRSREEIAALVEEHRSSGLSQRAYAHSKGLSLSTLGHWIRDRHAETSEYTMQFIPGRSLDRVVRALARRRAIALGRAALAESTGEAEAELSSLLLGAEGSRPASRAYYLAVARIGAGAPCAALLLEIPAAGAGLSLRLVARSGPGEETIEGVSRVASRGRWLRLERRGSAVTGRSSSNPASWGEPLGTVDLPSLGDRALFGFAACGAEPPPEEPFVALEARCSALSFGMSPPPARFHRGDPNSNATTDISDAIAIFGFLFLGDADPSCKESADTNNDGTIDISDGIHLLNWLFVGGPEPSPPGPAGVACGLDPDQAGSRGDLGCEMYAACN